MKNIFERVSKLKLRFNTSKGQITTEDLWDLPLTSPRGVSLDAVAKVVYTQLEQTPVKSFVTKTTRTNSELSLKFDIVKHIIDVKLAERDAKELEATNKARKNLILETIQEKKISELKDKSVEELQKELEEL